MLTGIGTLASDFRKKFQGPSLLVIAIALVTILPLNGHAEQDPQVKSLVAARWKWAYATPTKLIREILERAQDPKQRLELIAQLNPHIKASSDIAYVKQTHQKLVDASELLKLPTEHKTILEINQAGIVNFWTTTEVRKYFDIIFTERREQVSLETYKYILTHLPEFGTTLSQANLLAIASDYYARSAKLGTLSGREALQLSEFVWKDVLRGSDIPGIRYTDIAQDPGFLFRRELLLRAAQLDREQTLRFCKEKFARFLRYTQRSTFATKEFENGMPRSAWQEGRVYSEILALNSSSAEFDELLKDISAEVDRLMLDFYIDTTGNKNPTYVYVETVGSEMIRMLKSQREL